MSKLSKQREAKKEQNYSRELNTCSNCKHYQSEYVEKRYEAFSGTQTWVEEKNKRCGIGGFAVNKMATCNLHDLRK